MATNYVQDGQTVNYTNATGSDIASGAVVVIGAMIGIAVTDIPDTQTGAVRVEGVAEIPKATGSAINQGAAVDYDVSLGNADGNLTPATGDLTGCGIAWETAASGDTTVLVKLNASAATVS